MNYFAKPLLILSLLILITFLTSPTKVFANLGVGHYSTNGANIIDSQGTLIRLAGVNLVGPLYGPEISAGFESKLDQIKKSGFDTVRLLFATEALDPANKTVALQSFDRAVNHASKLGLKIVLDRHRMKFADTTESALWYSSYSEDRWIDDWKFLANKYLNNPTVIGADLHNEPHDPACWGCGNTRYDWRLAAEKAGNAILEKNPNWLIIVEGVGGSGFWWGGNLSGAKNNPVRLNIQNKLVYQAHEYGSNLTNPPKEPAYFNSQNFPNDLPDRWDREWGYLAKENIAPLLIGEFGTGLRGAKEIKWFDKLIDYIDKNNLSWTYFAWHRYDHKTPSGTGLLEKDWTPRQNIQLKLTTIKNARIINITPTPTPGDANNDGQINNTDLAILKVNFGKTGDTTIGNFNSDSIVDGLDYAIWFVNYGK